MSEGNAKVDTMKKTYQVEYNATYWVEAESEEQAIELAIDEHEDLPNGDWSAFVEQQWGNK